MKNKEYDQGWYSWYNFLKNILHIIKIYLIIKKPLKNRFVTTPIQCKNHTSVKRRHIQYKICNDTLAVSYSADIVPEKKIHKEKLRVRYFCNLL